MIKPGKAERIPLSLEDLRIITEVLLEKLRGRKPIPTEDLKILDLYCKLTRLLIRRTRAAREKNVSPN